MSSSPASSAPEDAAAMKETEVAVLVVERLRDDGWEVFQEVACAGSVADIVAVRKRITWIVEVKTKFSLDLVAQAVNWVKLGAASFVSIAYPRKTASAREQLITEILTERKIGRIIVGDRYNNIIPPQFIRRHRGHRINIRKHLFAAQKTSIAGSAHGGHWTPWKRTCEVLREHVYANPGCTMREAVEAINHHYMRDSTARACLLTQIRDGALEGIETKRDGRALTLHLKPQPPA